MNTKSTIFLMLMALVVLGAIYYTKHKEEQTFSSAAIPEKTIPSITSGTIERITIDAPDYDSVTLTKVDGRWYTNVDKKYEADQALANAAVKAVEEPIGATVVSTNPDSYDDYHVSDTSGTKVQIFEHGKQQPVLAMIVGDDTASAFSTYVRLEGEEEVLNARASLSMAFKRPDGWRDKKIFNFSGSLATRVEAEGSSATFTVVREGEEKWRFEGEPQGEAELARVNSLANMLGNLRANEFVAVDATQPPPGFGLAPPRQSLSLNYEDKTTSPSTPTSVTLLIGNEVGSSGDWYAMRGDSEDIFTIGAPVVEALSPDPGSIKVPEAEPEPAPEAEETTATQALTTGSLETEAIDDDSTVTDATVANDPMTTPSAATTTSPM